MIWHTLFCTLVVLSPIVTAYRSFDRIPHFHPHDFSAHPRANRNGYADDPLVKRCTEHTRSTTLDHFTWAPNGGFQTFTQRYFICDEFWNRTPDKEKGPIFLYLGNEAGVEKYIKSTGLMWEMAPDFGALLVFIEHRYYGKSKPFGNAFKEHLEYLSVEQALGDYVEFIYDLQEELGGHNLPVIGFGGSYGGMLGAWMRMKYPHAIHGVIASSAPIWSFMGEIPPVNPNYFDQIKTYDATPLAGSAAACAPNIKKTWYTLFDVAADVETPGRGPDGLKKALRLCPDVSLAEPVQIVRVMHWINHAIGIMAEGSYGFPSDYMTEGVANLPPYPLRLGCSYLSENLDGIDLLTGVGNMVAIFYNVTKDLECLPLHREVSKAADEITLLWNYQYCTEMFQMFGSDGVHDMFWQDPWDPEETMAYCTISQGVQSRPYWATQQWGGKEIQTTSNIIFSNGEYDPWRGGGVQQNVSDTVVALIIKEGGHHADLMFESEHDNDSLKAVRKFEKESIAKWILEVKKRNAELKAMMATSPPEMSENLLSGFDVRLGVDFYEKGHPQ